MEDVEMSDQTGEAMPIPTTDNVEFVSYKTLLDSFFSNKDNFDRLKKIERMRGEDVYPTIVHFVKNYENGRVRKNEDNNFVCIPDMYSKAITSHKKRYYDFCSVFGKGELVFNGKVNPYVCISNDNEQVVATLPCLVAVWWFIRYGFDHIFWDEYDSVKKAYQEYTTAMKRQYSAAHKAYNSEIKKAAVERVIQDRPKGSSISQPKGRKKPILSAAERKLLAEYMEQERNNRRGKATQKNKQTKKAKKKASAPLMLMDAGMFGEDEDF